MRYEKPEIALFEYDEEDVIRTSLTDVGTEDGDDSIDLNEIN